MRAKPLSIYAQKIFCICLTIFACQPSRLQANLTPWTFFSSRPLAMGNTFISIADDHNSLFYNPAGLGNLNEWDGEFFNPTLEISSRTVTFLEDLLQFTNTSSSINKTLELISPQIGNSHHISSKISPFFVKKNFGIALAINNYFDLTPHGMINIDVSAGTNVYLPIGISTAFFQNKLLLGANLKGRFQSFISETIGIETIGKFQDKENSQNPLLDSLRTGYALGVDFGVLFTPFPKTSPTIGISLFDLGGTRYHGLKNSGKAKNDFPTLNMGISHYIFRKSGLYLLSALEMHMINRPLHHSQKLRFGIEWGFSKTVKLQAGLNGGYLSFGLQMDVGILNLILASYSIDHGPIAGMHSKLQERRYLLQFKLLL